MKLYYSPGACSLAPHIALREAGAEFELVRVSVFEKAHQAADYLRVNPRARVPALESDGSVYTEAAGLLVYIASLRPEAGLLPPGGEPALARVLEWIAWFSSSHHVAFACYWRPERFLPAGADSSELIAFGRATIERMNAEVEERLAGPWLIGGAYSLADIYALPFYRWGRRIGLDMTALYPRWTDWTARMLEREAVRAAIEAEGLGAAEFIPAFADSVRSCR
jgi:glutathione S-transferase